MRATLVGGKRRDPKLEVTRPGPGLSLCPWDSHGPERASAFPPKTAAVPHPRCGARTGQLLRGGHLLVLTSACPLLSPLPGGSRVDNEEEEEEGDGGLEPSCPPTAYQMHPPPEGCCTTDGELPALPGSARCPVSVAVPVPTAPSGQWLGALPPVPAALATPGPVGSAKLTASQPLSGHYEWIQIPKFVFLY